MSTLAAVADELYALAPDDFTAARDAAAKRARGSGDRELADEVKLLRRPSVGAWLVNQLARSNPAELDELLELGETLRAAQDALDGAELRTMSKQRREVVASLSKLAQGIAHDADRKVGDAALRELETTLEAALADDAAARAVRSGRLMRSLASTGLEAVDLTGAVAAPEDLPQRTTRRTGKQAGPKRSSKSAPGSKPTSKPISKDTAARKPESKRRAAARKADEQAVRTAQRALDAAEADLADQEAAAQAARDAVKSARARAAEAEAALEEANRATREAEKQRREAEQAHRGAVRARDSARRAVAVARKRAERE